jgi:endonuclease/exonuclease/phosphatase (EEP) superfamily protein YafD
MHLTSLRYNLARYKRRRSHRGGPLSNARRTSSVVTGAFLLILSSAALAVRYVPLSNHPMVFASVASPFLMVAAPLALASLLRGRWWVLSGLAGALTLALVLVQLPLYVGEDPGPDTVRVRVMTINMYLGQADALAIVREAAVDADVLFVQELTPDAVRALAAAGIDNTLPNHALDPRNEAAGVGIYTRYPMTSSDRMTGYEMAMVSARLRIEGTRADTTVAAAHFAAPWPQRVDGWRGDLERFPSTLADFAAQARGSSVVVGGDFNATVDMSPFRGLLTNGYRDATEQAGAGRQFTYPGNRRIPPFMGIDHVLTRNGTAVSAHTVSIAGSDHRALLATVLLPPG